LETDALCRARFPRSIESNALFESQGPFRRPTPSTPPSRSRAPSTDESFVRAHPLARMDRFEGRHRYRGFAASARLPTRIHAFGNALDLSPSLSGRRLPRGKASSPPCELEREGHMPLVDFCSCHGPTSTASILPDPTFQVASHPGWVTTPESAANWVLSAQGFVDRRSGLETPHLRIRMPRWIDPNPSQPRHLLSLTDALRLWNDETKRDRADLAVPPGPLGTCVGGSDSPGQSSSEKLDPPLGPPSTAAREKRLLGPHPRCLPSPRPPNPGRVAATRGWFPHRSTEIQEQVALPARSSLRWLGLPRHLSYRPADEALTSPFPAPAQLHHVRSEEPPRRGCSAL